MTRGKKSIKEIFSDIQKEVFELVEEKSIKNYQNKIEKIVHQVMNSEIKKAKDFLSKQKKEIDPTKIEKLVKKTVNDEIKKAKTFLNQQKKEVSRLQKKIESLISNQKAPSPRRKARKKTTNTKKS